MTHRNVKGEVTIPTDTWERLQANQIPASMDLASLWPSDDAKGIRVRCDYCSADLGTAKYLAQVVLLWRSHQREFSKADE